MAEEIKDKAENPEKEEIKAKPAKTEKKEPEKKEKVKLGARIKKFFSDYKSELKRVVWPTRAQVIKNTGVVLFVIIIMAAVIGVLDLVFGFGVSQLRNLKDLIVR